MFYLISFLKYLNIHKNFNYFIKWNDIIINKLPFEMIWYYNPYLKSISIPLKLLSPYLFGITILDLFIYLINLLKIEFRLNQWSLLKYY